MFTPKVYMFVYLGIVYLGIKANNMRASGGVDILY